MVVGWHLVFPLPSKPVTKYQQLLKDLRELGSYTIGKTKVTYKALPSKLKKRKPRRFSTDRVEAVFQ
jgi:hypothetical protein